MRRAHVKASSETGPGIAAFMAAKDDAQLDGNTVSLVRKVLEAAGGAGVRPIEVAERIHGMDIHRATWALRRMVKRGQAWHVRVSARNARYFATEAGKTAFETALERQRQLRQRPTPGKAPAPPPVTVPCGWAKDAQVIVPAHVVPQRFDGPPDRFTALSEFHPLLRN